MDYELKKKSLSVRETVFEGNREQSIDVDFTLPDYCPDIQKILKCTACPKIYSRNISADRLDIEGTVSVEVLYVDSVKHTLRKAMQAFSFSTFFNLKGAPPAAAVFTDTVPRYLNCRAVSSRRLDIHGAFCVFAKVVSKGERSLACDSDEKDIERRSRALNISDYTGIGQQQFNISEEIELPHGKPPVEVILKTELRAGITESKPVAGKVMVKGEAKLRVLYLSDLDTGNVEAMDYTAAFNGILDAQGIDEKSTCITKAEVLSCDVKMRNDPTEESGIILLDAKISVTAEGFNESEISVMTDAFSKLYEVELAYENINLVKLEKINSQSIMVKDTIEIEAVGKIIDIFCERVSLERQNEQNKAVIKGKLNICILALDGSNTPLYIERPMQFDYAIDSEVPVEYLQTVQSAVPSTLSYRLNGENNIDIRAEIKICTEQYRTVNARCVSKITADEEKPRQKDKNAALTLYYADKGESVWDIAKEYCICPDAVRAENENLEDCAESRRMLFIPNI